MAIEIHNLTVVENLAKDAVERKLRAFEQGAADLAAGILVRTQRGKDVQGNSFEPYTPAYAKRRQQAGRQTTRPDLLFSGKMLNAVQTKTERTPTGSVATIYFNSAQEALKAQGNQKKRRFFGLSDEQLRRLIAVVDKA